jgi:photosystem II stability/assembly factor-like uncharacterized protein
VRPAILALAFVASVASAATWTSHGPYGGSITAMASSANRRVIIAGEAIGIFRSDDAGETWRDVSGGLGDIGFIAIDPRDANVVYLTAGQRIFKSTTGGAPWIDITGSLGASFHPAGLLIDPQNPDTIYAGSRCVDVFKTAEATDGAGVFKSADGGKTWASTLQVESVLVRCAAEIALDPAAPSHLYLATAFGQELESLDGGVSWDLAYRVPTREIVGRYGIGSRANRGGPGFLISGDGGVTWSPVEVNGLKDFSTFYDLAIDGARLFLATANGLFQSDDEGKNWTAAGPPLVTTGVVPGARLVIGTSRGIYPPAELHDLETNVVSIAADPRAPSIIYASTADPSSPGELQGRVFRSDDFGASWQEITDIADVRERGELSVDASGNLHTFGRNGAFLLPAGSTQWAHVDDHVYVGYGANIAVVRTKPNFVYKIERLGDLQSALFLSEKSGSADSWITLHYPGEFELGGRVAVDPFDEKRIYVTTASRGVLRSVDQGKTWTSLGDGMPNRPIIAVAIDDMGTFLHVAVQGAGVWDLPLFARTRGRAVR